MQLCGPPLKAFHKVGQKLKSNLSAQGRPTVEGKTSAPVDSRDRTFLEKGMAEGGLEDLYDGRDVTEVVFRIMRDLVTTEAANRVADVLHEPAKPTKNKVLQTEVADLSSMYSLS